MFTQPDYTRLEKPISADRVKTRSQSGQRLSYIESHDAIRTANEIFGIGGWSYEIVELTHIGTEPMGRNGKSGYKTGYRAVVKVTVRPPDEFPVTFSDVGFGDSVDYSGSQISTHELAMKEAASDGLKRALRSLGDQFGLGLYDAERRADVERRRGLTSDAAVKKEVWKIAKDRTGKDKPSLAEVAAVFDREPNEITDVAVLRQILTDEGVL